MGKFISHIFIGIIVSCYLFPFGLTFLPENVNTKMIMGVVGVLFFVIDCIPKGGLYVPRQMVGAIMLAVLFSVICFYAAEYNNTSDYSYASYFISFFVWLAGAYAVGRIIRMYHGRFDFILLTYYLAGVCFVQCGLAVLIDNVEPLKDLVDRYIQQGQSFLKDVGRLYGIGASLDPAGVRFSVVLILISALICHSDYVRSKKKTIIQLVIAFFTISIIGNMIARTTSVGMSMALIYILLFSGVLNLTLKGRYFKFYFIFFGSLILAIVLSVYLYNVNESFHKDLRFAFEGFFNWVEAGKWTTSSTEKLNTRMWIWPDDMKTWIIGSGLFGGFIYSTDIGYCRFILYCGLIGFSSFALFFVYNAVSFWKRCKDFKWLFLFLLALTFIIWIKVATDIFFIYALCYCLDNLDLTNQKFNSKVVDK